jgi:hypothetical protein
MTPFGQSAHVMLKLTDEYILRPSHWEKSINES